MVLPIYIYGSTVLKRKAEQLTPDYPELRQLISDMRETLANADGVGLAAPQVGHSIRLFITDGAPRRIAVGKGKGILFKHTSEARSLAYKSKLLMLIVSALREIGEGKATQQQLEIIKSHLSHISEQEFKTDIQLMPIWVRKILLSL